MRMPLQGLGLRPMLSKIFYFYLLLFLASASAYEPIDVVIPVAAKDAKTLEYCIDGIRNNCQQVRDIFILSKEPYTDKAEWIDEQAFPFSKEEVASCLSLLSQEKNQRVGWYFQQLLKLYAAFVIPEISNNILVLDADTIFLNKVSFISSKGKALYNPGTENHSPYFQHCAKLLPRFRKVFPELSGISHHMLMQRECLEELFIQVEQHTQMEFWRAFCLNVDPEQVRASGASEYELYFNFVFSIPYAVELRFLRWANKPAIKSKEMAQKLIQEARREGLDYISCHEYTHKGS